MSSRRRAGKPRLLFVTPTVPAPAGNGLAMRTHLFLEALAADHDVHLLLAFVVGFEPTTERLAALRTLCADVKVFLLSEREDAKFELIAGIADPRLRAAALASYPMPLLGRFARDTVIREAAGLFRRVGFDAVHVARLYLAPLATPYLGRARCTLDLDEHESKTRRRLAALYAAVGRQDWADFEAAESRKYAAWEEAYVPRFDRVFVCSESDRAELAARLSGARLSVVPNAVRIPAALRRGPRAGPFGVLFVGTLDHFPNEDAARYFCVEVLPRLRARAARPVRLTIVSQRPPESVRALAALPDVALAASVPDVATYYRDADVVVAPLRTGGGTRIKILEAFAHRRPVVATSVGIEGLEVVPGMHALVADSPDGLAGACLELMGSARLRRALVERAFALVSERYAVPVVTALIRA